MIVFSSLLFGILGGYLLSICACLPGQLLIDLFHKLFIKIGLINNNKIDDAIEATENNVLPKS